MERIIINLAGLICKLLDFVDTIQLLKVMMKSIKM